MATAVPREDDRLAILEAKVAGLGQSLATLESRLALLEQQAAAAPRTLTGVRAAPEGEEEEALPLPSDLTRVVGFTGRTLIVFGGAYLLRAITAAGYLPEQTGLLLAFLYALTWLSLADRVGARGAALSAAVQGAALSAAFHGATAVLIGLPLLWETTARFHYLEPAAAGLALAVFVAATLAVAWRRSLQGLAWILGFGTLATVLALLGATRSPAPFSLSLVVLGVGGLALYYGRGWHAAGWWLTLLGHLGGFLAAFGALAQEKDTGAALALVLLLGLSFLGLLAWRTLRQGGEVGIFEAAQAGLAAAVGYGGAALLAQRLGAAAVVPVGVLGLLVAVAAYTAAFRLIPRERRAKLLLWSSLALAAVLAGSGLLLPAPARAPVWSLLAVLAGWQAVVRSRVTLSLHGAFYSLAAAAASGLLTTSAYAFGAPAGTAWPALPLAALLALAAAAVVCALPVPHPAPFWKPYEGLTRVVQITVFLWGAAGMTLYYLAPALAGPHDAGLLATLRTAVLTAVALLLGWAARRPRFREAGWLVYPTLALAALKLAVEDFPQGRPATLFLALALCGLAFIFAPRLARQAAPA